MDIGLKWVSFMVYKLNLTKGIKNGALLSNLWKKIIFNIEILLNYHLSLLTVSNV